MHNWDELYTRFLKKQCSADEIRQLLVHFDQEGSRSPLAERVRSELANTELPLTDPPAIETAYNRIFQQLKTEIGHASSTTQRWNRKLRGWLPYAAAVLLVAASGAWLLTRKERPNEPQIVDAAAIKPGGNHATLTLADGSIVSLSPSQEGITVGESLRYDDGSVLDVSSASTGDVPSETYAVLTTPKGGTYRITLGDGTTVWLNSASTLKYPLAFNGAAREVELTGEAYFDVQKQKKPFIVKSKMQSIEVLGTQFNVNAYPDEKETQTTLVKGSVAVSAVDKSGSLRLIPGEQCSLSGTILTKAKVDVSTFVAWKDGLFSFNETELTLVMNQLSRWYNIDVVYEGDIPSTHYFGDIHRHEPLSNVLELLKASGLRFRVERVDGANRLVVMP